MTDRPELVIALVCPLGARMDVLTKALRDELRLFDYQADEISISDELKKCETGIPEPGRGEEARIRARQAQALRMREMGPDVLARMAIAAIRSARARVTGSSNKPAPARAYILRQLKHPSEVHLLRKVYGSSFVLVAGSAHETARIKELAKKIAADHSDVDHRKYEHAAADLIAVDEKESESREWSDRGQNTRDTFPLADYFVDLTSNADSARRFVRLLFGHPFETPTQDEVAMHQAAAVSQRSSDERRQVGAVIVKRTPRIAASDKEPLPPSDSDIVASGMNEVPRRQGGSYWPGEFFDARDQNLTRSSPRTRENSVKQSVVSEVASRLQNANWLQGEYSKMGLDFLGGHLLQLLEGSQLSDIGEFSRQVHAEMAAIVDAAKRGVPVLGAEMFVTAFPCHNCAKHIIAAGITRVVYLEPYPKSRAKTLHEEEITDHPNGERDRVFFLPFAGVAPRQFFRLFSMSQRGRKGYKDLTLWERDMTTLEPRHLLANAWLSYTHSEREELLLLPKQYKGDPSATA